MLKEQDTIKIHHANFKNELIMREAGTWRKPLSSGTQSPPKTEAAGEGRKPSTLHPSRTLHQITSGSHLPLGKRRERRDSPGPQVCSST